MNLNIGIELTNNCNFRCRYCPHSLYQQSSTPSGNRFTREMGFMSPELFHKAIQESTKWAQNVSLGFFGEQLLHPQFKELILSVPKRRPFIFVLNSNWSLVTEDMLDALRCFGSVRISLDAADKETWEASCPGGPVKDLDGTLRHDRYEALVEKVRWWLGLKERPRTWLICVRQRGIDEKKLVDTWKPLLRKGDTLITKAMLTYGGVMRDPSMKNHACDVHKENRLIIGYNGVCSPCNLDVNLELEVGNLNTQTIGEIVKSEKWRDVLVEVKAKRGICANCFDGGNHSQTFYRGTT